MARIWKVSAFMLLLVLVVLVGVKDGSGASIEQEAEVTMSIKENESIQGFYNASVHDPSIVKADNIYYVIGSHIDGAKSTDLINWENYTNGYTTPGNTIFGDLSTNLAESFEWAGENDADSQGGYAVWAPEVIWNEHYLNEDGSKGAYMIYYSVSSTYIRSAVGYAVSKEIEGPFEYVDTIMYSGFYDHDAYDPNSDVNKNWIHTNIPSLIEDGIIDEPNPNWFTEQGGYNYRIYTNSIDANLFFDEKGKLWMTYGSWAGGIFIMEVDPETGQPLYPGEDGLTEDGRLIDRYFGTKIAGGYGHSIEGPYVYYDDVEGYYYLFATYGGLSSSGGYQMRTFRSKNPDGPYEDAAGKMAVFPDSLDDGTVRNKVDSYEHAEFGNKMIGNFLFEHKVGDEGTGEDYGYVSPGHNSVYMSEETGERFLVFHTRFPDRGEMHEVRVHQMFMNKNGWPVVAPYRHTGETLEKIHRKEVIGDYYLIEHGKEITSEIEKQKYITLTKNNKVTGDVKGSWKRTAHNLAELTIEGKVYEGVFLKQYNPGLERDVVTFTLMSKDGEMIWGSQLGERSSKEVTEDVLKDLTLGDTEQVISDLTLPTEGTRNAVISWESSDPAIITSTGQVTRPAAGEDEELATLTATITHGKETAKKTFEIRVLPYREKGLIAHYPFDRDLTDRTGNFGEGTITGERITYTGGSLSYETGVNQEAVVFDGGSGVRLPKGLIASDQYSVSLWVKPDELTTFTTTFFGARDENNWISLLPRGPIQEQTMLWSGSAQWYEATTGFSIKKGKWSHLAFTYNKGKVEVFINGSSHFSGEDFPNVFTTMKADFSLAVNWWDAPFVGLMDDLRIYEGALSENEIKHLFNHN
ncbi:arabinanase [Alkalihalobacillus alcalophilus ATCC 27647 = CGMCC 1.3604]|uniref:Arabinanase n=1 Tax=Alkalihalobacillus alcalophilus ATCC 27647 = CGMCC 1.3604 TaxID=1218173 RepID=A0A094XI84_ALKAL|nr:LamG-like jellyroll fold domain-containing protein [Alkalihalobacillus alcalophilus]KGA98500.1 arabinanase [Alkalihalobacillus alcalophilus ATCC 27647 = CGMCC 1.3604]MED1563732.1 family 43 glycosylhydrolase [Alkalihalobacillus alcalophilus]THG91037.1 arabinanase [Alkalihalobacillus alcalophilus ATCC 27647 = CGMCC 1.3604]